MRARLRRGQGGLPAQVKVDTVVDYQGQEVTIVIVDFTAPPLRADDPSNIGFAGDAKGLNVALTRAKVAMVIIGNWARWVSHLPALLSINAGAASKNFGTLSQLTSMISFMTLVSSVKVLGDFFTLQVAGAMYQKWQAAVAQLKTRYPPLLNYLLDLHDARVTAGRALDTAPFATDAEQQNNYAQRSKIPRPCWPTKMALFKASRRKGLWRIPFYYCKLNGPPKPAADDSAPTGPAATD